MIQGAVWKQFIDLPKMWVICVTHYVFYVKVRSISGARAKSHDAPAWRYPSFSNHRFDVLDLKVSTHVKSTTGRLSFPDF